MTVVQSDMYLTNREWFRAVVGGTNEVLCHLSALECLELFSGYFRESQIDVYATEKGIYENVNYRVIKDISSLETVRIGALVCTSASQTINDILDDFDNADEQSLVEALSCYYYGNGKSFNGLRIEPRNAEKFAAIEDWAIEYYEGA